MTQKIKTAYERVMQKVEVRGSDDCWNFVGRLDNGGYATIRRSSSPADVKEIRFLGKQGEEVSRLALDYSVHETSIYRILKGDTWKHLLVEGDKIG